MAGEEIYTRALDSGMQPTGSFYHGGVKDSTYLKSSAGHYCETIRTTNARKYIFYSNTRKEER